MLLSELLKGVTRPDRGEASMTRGTGKLDNIQCSSDAEVQKMYNR